MSSALKTLTSLNKESRPFGGFPHFLPLAITAFGGPEGYSCLAIKAFGAFGFIVPKCYYRLGKMEGTKKEPRLLNLRRLRSSRNFPVSYRNLVSIF